MPIIESVVQIFFILKDARKKYKNNQRDGYLLLDRLKGLEEPLLKFQSHELSVSEDSLKTLEEVLNKVKQFLDEYNTRSMWRACMRAIRSGKYAEDFAHVNQLIDRALQTVGISLDISNEERRQQDLDDMKNKIENLSRHVIENTRPPTSGNNEEEKKRYEDILISVKDLSVHQESIVQTLLQVTGHEDCALSVEEKADFVKMHQEVEELITAEADRLNEGIEGLKDDMEEMKKDILTALLDSKSDSMTNEKKAVLNAKMTELYESVKEKDISLDAEIGSGGFGCVFSAWWNDIPVAVKKFTPVSGIPKEIVISKKAIEREAFILDAMKHPLVLGSHGIVKIDEREQWLVMDLAKYRSLMSFLLKYPLPDQLPLFLIFGIMKDLAAAVAHLHSHGVTHKDIKAENVLLHNSPYEFCVKLCDFGLAKQESMGTGKTVAPTMVSIAGAGTLAFMAPELQNPDLAKDRHSSTASDVFAICVTFLQMLLRYTPNNSTFGFQTKIHEAVSLYFFEDSDEDLKSALNKLMVILYEGLSLDVPPDVPLDVSCIEEIPRVFINPETLNCWKRPFARDLGKRMSIIVDTHLGGDGRKRAPPTNGISETFNRNKKMVKMLANAYDEGVGVDLDALVNTASSNKDSLKIGGNTLPPTPPLTHVSHRDQDKMGKLISWMTDLGVKESDAEEYTNNIFAKKLTTIARLKKYVVKKGASVLTDEVGMEEMDAADILEALMIEESDDHTGNVHGNAVANDHHAARRAVNNNGKVAAIGPKLVRSNGDIKPAVKLWCSDRAAAELKYGHISEWDTSAVTNMKHLFNEMKDFNDDISQWNVGNVTNMHSVFRLASAFNQPLDQWNVGNVTNMDSMFSGASAFNQPLGEWNVGHVTTMGSMFIGASAFNQPLDQWNVGNVTNMHSLFCLASAFNQPLELWNVGNVTKMYGMFFESGMTTDNRPSWLR